MRCPIFINIINVDRWTRLHQAISQGDTADCAGATVENWCQMGRSPIPECCGKNFIWNVDARATRASLMHKV